MAGIKQRGPQSLNRRFFLNGCEYEPVVCVLINGKRVMSAQCKQHGTIPRDPRGKVLARQHIRWD